MKKKIACFLSLLVGAISSISNAQSTDNSGNLLNDMHPITPSEYQFIKYTDMPVSEYSGIPSISVPLYEINLDDVEIPIGLTYHSKGIRVSEDASWVGLGWDMTFGSIIQIINDQDDLSSGNVKRRPDFFDSPIPELLPPVSSCGILNTAPINPYPSDYPTYGNLIYPYTTYEISINNYLPVNGSYGIYNESDMISENNFDSEPDIFKANFLGYSVNFKLDWNTNQIVVLNQQGYSVTLLSDNNWEIIVPNGDQFYFQVATSITTSDLSYSGITNITSSNSPSPSSGIWMISKIITNKGREIDFNYSTTPSSYLCYPNISETLYNKTLLSSGNDADIYDVEVPNSYSVGGISDFTNYVGKNISTTSENHIFLNSITYPSGSIIFNSSPANDRYGDNKLDSISVKSITNNWIKSYKFNYSYFDTITTEHKMTLNNNFDPVGGLRLKLNSVNLPDGSSYSFNYNTTPLPHKNSFAQDYWGYYNGAINDTTLIPNPAQFVSSILSASEQTLASSLGSNGDNHSANITYAQAGILQQIVYPTGGTTNFTYELNQFDNYWMPDFSSSTNTITSGNGLRIKNIQNNQPDGTLSTSTNYTYYGGRDVVNRSSIFSTYYFYLTQFAAPCSVSASIIDNYYHMILVNSNGAFSASILGSFQGVGYDSVAKTSVDASGNSNGKIVTSFNNNPDMLGALASDAIMMYVTMPAFRNVNVPENGTTSNVAIYDNLGNKVKNLTNTYSNFISPLDYGARIFSYCNEICLNFCYGTGDGAESGQPVLNWNIDYEHLISDYPIQSCKSYLTSSTETDYFGANSVNKTTNYTYDPIYGNVVSKTYTNSLGESDFTYYSHPADFATAWQYDPYTIMLNKNEVAPVIEMKHLKEKAGNVFHEGEIHTYQAYNANQVFNDAIYKTETAYPNESIVIASYNGTPTLGSLNMEATYALKNSINYNNQGNATSIVKEGGAKETLIWDYNNSYVTAEVENASNVYANNGNVTFPAIVSTSTVTLASPTTVSNTINLNTPGNIVITLQTPASGVNAQNVHYDVTLYDGSHQTGTLCNYSGTSSCGAAGSSYTYAVSSSTLTNYTIALSWISSTPSSGPPVVTISYPYTPPSQLYYDNIAQNLNAAYTSFEYLTTDNYTNGSGNITGISSANVIGAPGTAPTGDYYYHISGAPLSVASLDNTKKYVVSYWSDNGSCTISGYTTITTGNSMTIGGKTWIYYENTSSSAGSPTSVSGTGNIDELRIYPVDASMKTYTYQPLIGISAMSDENNKITRYSYDNATRLSLIKDANGNIIKKYQYGIQAGE